MTVSFDITVPIQKGNLRYPYSDELLWQMADDLVDAAKHGIVRHGGSAPPFMIVFLPGDQSLFLELDDALSGETWEVFDEKATELIHALQYLMRQERAIAFAFVSECWMAPEESAAKMERRGPIDDLPGCKEAISLLVETTMSSTIVNYDIKRENGRVEFAAPDKRSARRRDGRFVGLITEGVPP